MQSAANIAKKETWKHKGIMICATNKKQIIRKQKQRSAAETEE